MEPLKEDEDGGGWSPSAAQDEALTGPHPPERLARIKIMMESLKESPDPIARKVAVDYPDEARALCGVVARMADAGIGLDDDETDDTDEEETDRQRGRDEETDPIKHEGTRLVLGAMTPEQARAKLASRAARRGTSPARSGRAPTMEANGYTLAWLDAKMGLRKAGDPIERDGTRLRLGVMTPDQARARRERGHR